MKHPSSTAGWTLPATSRASCAWFRFTLAALLLTLCIPTVWAQESNADSERDEASAQAMVEALSARAMVEETTKRITLVLLDKERSKEKKRDDFESIMMGRLDIHLISKLVMGNNWVEFSSDEKQVFRNRFEKYLVQSYWNVVEGHAFIDISVEGIKQFVRNGRPEKREWVVSTLITREGKPDETVGLRVRRTTPSGDKPGDWKIIDMIDRLGSRISVHKGDLDSVFTEHGTKGVLKELAQKIRPH